MAAAPTAEPRAKQPWRSLSWAPEASRSLVGSGYASWASAGTTSAESCAIVATSTQSLAKLQIGDLDLRLSPRSGASSTSTSTAGAPAGVRHRKMRPGGGSMNIQSRGLRLVCPQGCGATLTVPMPTLAEVNESSGDTSLTN